MKDILEEFDKLAKINQMDGVEGYSLGNGETVDTIKKRIIYVRDFIERALTDTTSETEEEHLRECKTCPQYFSNKGFVCPLHYCQHFKAVFGLKAFDDITREATK